MHDLLTLQAVPGSPAQAVPARPGSPVITQWTGRDVGALDGGGLPALLQGGVVGLALHRQQVLEGTALPGRGMQDVLVGAEHVFDNTHHH